MENGVILRPVMMALVMLTLVSSWQTVAAACPEPELKPGPARSLALPDILRLPKHTNLSLENTEVTTVGYLMRIREVKLRPSLCRQSIKVFRLWLAAGKPHGLKGVKHRHRAVVATVARSVVMDRFHGPRSLKELVGKRVRVTGRLTFVSYRGGELLWTRASPWELRSLSEIVPCPIGRCGPGNGAGVGYMAGSTASAPLSLP